jgi:hypothetical protein
MPCAGRKSVMVVMPSLPESQYAKEKIVAALISSFVVLKTPDMADTVHAPSDVVDHEDTNQSAP